MIDISELYRASNNGLDIIFYYYPAARGCEEHKNKHFKRRAEEDDASACLKLFNTKDGQVYKVTDFGDTGTAMSPIDICMSEEGLRFNEALAVLAERYGVSSELNRNINKPEIRQRPATTDEKDGSKFFQLETECPAHHLAVMGGAVKAKHFEALNWYLAKSISYVRNRQVTTKLSTDKYPIFMRECFIDSDDPKSPRFYKIYEPLNPDKQYRFSYTPDGVKPRRYTNGLFELRRAYQDYNNAEEKIHCATDSKEPYKEKKLREAFICSGERDALCVRALGSHPIWFNSETYKISPEEIREIYKYVDMIYNIPDIDNTGVRKGTELALKYIDIHTIWLPDWLRSFRDNRGKARKDFRDFVELRDKPSDFNNLIALAMPARFWVKKVNKRANTESYDIDSSCLHYFLRLNGFRTLKSSNLDAVKYIRITSNIVRQIKPKDIRRFLFDFAEERALPREVRNLLLNSPRLSDTALEHLQEIELDFTSFTPTSQLFFFGDKTIKVTDSEIKAVTEADLERYTWDSSVIPHKVKILEPMFNVSHSTSLEGNDIFDVKVVNSSSKLFAYIVNSSRIYWREELEYSLANYSVGDAEKYLQDHKFDIDGPNLTADQALEQKYNLVAKLFTIGYILHRYKSPSQAWAPYAMDNKMGSDGECNGRSGKSFLFRALSIFMSSVKLSGRNPKMMDNPHIFQHVTEHTDLVIVDDCSKYLATGFFYDNITSDMNVNPKNLAPYTIPFEQSPKFAFTTNYVPREFDPSSEGRLLYMVFSDYYHQKTAENDYLETRQIRDDFGKNLLADYDDSEWELDINFLMQCVQFYLSMSKLHIKIQPPMENIIKRKFQSDMGTSFEDWASVYFALGSDKLNVLTPRHEAYRNYLDTVPGLRNYSPQRFAKALTAFVELCPYIEELNPEEYRNNGKRIIGKNHLNETTEYIYLRTNRASEHDTPEIDALFNQE